MLVKGKVLRTNLIPRRRRGSMEQQAVSPNRSRGATLFMFLRSPSPETGNNKDQQEQRRQLQVYHPRSTFEISSRILNKKLARNQHLTR
ncbi:hypothetical protein PGTUg99_005759 [Puccinia graminis f. sp. tritici]|uniref:Uncharacterized protein n=1 Tax=Puccinia graminis f. sp. tritici TaxID=56615 RepID=A0A5B0PVY6_PUCGR|nr:hypothetical protein PGTUg99_005759 [Puccinia graminis f. sp. tritici]